jgi:hypothetical protein
MVMTEEDAQAYRALFEAILADLKPDGIREEDLAGRIANTSWRLRRIQSIARTFRSLGKSELDPAIEKADKEETGLAKMLQGYQKQFAKLRAKRRQRQIAEAFAKPTVSQLIH